MHIFGSAPTTLVQEIDEVLRLQKSQQICRDSPPQSSVPHPKSTDLERAILPLLGARSFDHHVRLKHPITNAGFEYDFWRSADGVAIEIMGYRADDEIYKDILKFHVHKDTRIGIVFVPRYKWISSRRTDTNYTATMKALSFADKFLDVDSLIAVPYDWKKSDNEGCWYIVDG